MSVLTEEIKKLDEKFDKIRLEEAVYDTQTKDLKATFLLSRHFNQDDEKIIEKHIAEKMVSCTGRNGYNNGISAEKRKSGK